MVRTTTIILYVIVTCLALFPEDGPIFFQSMLIRAQSSVPAQIKPWVLVIYVEGAFQSSAGFDTKEGCEAVGRAAVAAYAKRGIRATYRCSPNQPYRPKREAIASWPE